MQATSPKIIKKALATRPNEADAKLLEAARRARSEGGSFTEMYQTAASVTGLLELLAKLTGSSTEPPANTNWSAVANLIEETARRSMSVEAALFYLMSVESEAGDAL